MIYLAALAVLAVFLIFAFNNRFLGREFYEPRLGHHLAHWAGVVIQVGFVALMTAVLLEWLRGDFTRDQLWTVGVLWLVAGQAVELFVFHWVRRRPWAEIVAEYNPLTGHGWWLVPLAYLLMPVLVSGWLYGR
jgi:hypothetical protein